MKENEELIREGAHRLLSYHLRNYQRGQHDIDHLSVTGELTEELAISVADYIQHALVYIAKDLRSIEGWKQEEMGEVVEMFGESIQGLQHAALRLMAGEEQPKEEE